MLSESKVRKLYRKFYLKKKNSKRKQSHGNCCSMSTHFAMNEWKKKENIRNCDVFFCLFICVLKEIQLDFYVFNGVMQMNLFLLHFFLCVQQQKKIKHKKKRKYLSLNRNLYICDGEQKTRKRNFICISTF